MARNAIKSEFRTSKMANRSEMARNVIKSYFRTSEMATEKKICIDLKWPFQIDMQLFFLNVLTKWPPAAIFDGTTMSIIELVRDIWMSNACVKFEERSSKVIALTMKL